MFRRIMVALIVLLAGCGKAPPDEPSVPSPLIGSDSNRLWILARSSQVGDGRACKELYLSPNDPRYQGLAQKCDFWSRNYADYMSINGFPTVEHLHLQDSAYWRWYLGMRQTISDCWQAIGNLSITANVSKAQNMLANVTRAIHTTMPLRMKVVFRTIWAFGTTDV